VEKKDRESAKRTKGFFLVQGIAVELINIHNRWYNTMLIYSDILYQPALPPGRCKTAVKYQIHSAGI
jgi:hypothetical protein